MSKLTRIIRRFIHADEAATTAEYGIAIVLVAGFAIFLLTQLNTVLEVLYGKFASKANDAN